MSKTAIKACSCKHEDQDRRYGAGMRVFNQKKTAPKRPPEFRCTVCLKETT